MVDIAGGSGRRGDVANYVINLDVIKAPKRCVGTGRRVCLLPVVHATIQWICSLKKKKKKKKKTLAYGTMKKRSLLHSIFSALEQTHCAHVTCASDSGAASFYSAFLIFTETAH